MQDVLSPVRLDARRDPSLSRWLWLVKWLLALPHVLVLAFLWIGVVGASIGAFFAILFTGRYPRALFDYNLGVLRWSWRVGFYTYGALGTDEYPPFSLDEEPDYPAQLHIERPGELSRGLVLVKWLLALPHLLVLGVLTGGGAWVVLGLGDEVAGGGLISLLVLIAGGFLLFTGRYPKALFDLILGLDRWVVRVGAYVALMTDDYPPFRLDQGGTDPATLVVGGEGRATPDGA